MTETKPTTTTVISTTSKINFIHNSSLSSATFKGLGPLEESPFGAFRWGIGPGTVLRLELAESQELILRFKLHNPIQNQRITIENNGKLVAHFSEILYRNTFEQEVRFQGEKQNTISINFAKWNHQTEVFPEDPRKIACMFVRLDLTATAGDMIQTTHERIEFPYVGSPLENEKLTRKAYGEGKSVLASLPTVVTLALTTRCNNKTPCLICDRNTRPQTSDSDITQEVIDAAEPFVKTTRYLLLHCGGEAMLSPFFDKVIKAVSPPTRVSFATNAMLMSKKRADLMLEKDIMAGFTISLDAATPKTYKIMRPSCDFDRVTQNVAYFLKRAAELGREKSTVTLNMTLCETNISDTPKLVLLAERLGAKAISFNPMNPGLTHVVTASDGRQWSYQREAVFSDPEQHDALLFETWQMAKEKDLRMSSHGITFIGPKAEDYKDIEREMTIVPFSENGEGQWYSSAHKPFGPCPFPCVKPWQEISIQPNGNVRACYYHDEDTWSIGNLVQTDAFSIWNSERIVADRKSFLKTGVAPQCRLTAACQHCVHLRK